MANIFKRLWRKITRKPYWYPNKESQKMLRKEADELIGWDKSINPCWNKSWKYFIKRQYPWYGLLELCQFKIIEMRDYMQNHSFINKKDTQKQIKQMTEVIELGRKILADEYENAAFQWNRDNEVSITIIYKKPDYPKNATLKDKISYNKKREELGRLYNTGIFEEIIGNQDLYNERLSEEGKTRLHNYIKDKDTRKLSEWLRDNNLTENDIETAYTSEYTNGLSEEENHKTSTQMYEEAWQDRRNDIAKYFECIGEYEYTWGD